ncbi:hypothetical protein D1793_13615 [Halomonas sp. JS92-SW72]|jgi:hypothetical protein|nr:hypothetical protein D1793_13615 [Halomonas sp. JS92-SW72]
MVVVAVGQARRCGKPGVGRCLAKGELEAGWCNLVARVGMLHHVGLGQRRGQQQRQDEHSTQPDGKSAPAGCCTLFGRLWTHLVELT